MPEAYTPPESIDSSGGFTSWVVNAFVVAEYVPLGE